MKNNHSRASVFLIEFTISILLFSLATAVCIQFFVKSHLKSRDSETLSHAIIETQNIAEIFRGTSGMGTDATINMLKKAYPDLENNDFSEVIIYYDENYRPCPKDKCRYMAKTSFTTKDGFITLVSVFAATDNNEEIYSLPLKIYLGEQQ